MSRDRIQDNEFEDWLQLDGEDTNWIASQTAQGLPLILPWKREAVQLGTCFHSKRLNDPWLKDNPFILSDFYLIPKILDTGYGSTSAFHSVSTESKTETGKHLALGFGAGVGLPFLCSASAKGTYDEDVKENNDSNKSSIRASVRSGTVELERKPRLSHEAMAMLKYGGGYDAFTKKYGDYFVWGYRLGGDTGLMISSHSFEKKKVEQYGITLTVEVLMVEASKTWTKDFYAFAAGKEMRLVGYDTLSDQNWNVSMKSTGDIQKLSEAAEQVMKNSQDLLERSVKALEDKHLFHGDHLSRTQCDILAKSGIVVELVLLPMSTLRDVARWTTERNVI